MMHLLFHVGNCQIRIYIVSTDIGELKVYNENQLQLRLQQCLRGKKVVKVLE